MTTLAHNLAILGISYDSWRLFTDETGDYALWLAAVAEDVQATELNGGR